jgi:serine/threonine protein kinase HipA of HipAB toxin-antitoxin module
MDWTMTDDELPQDVHALRPEEREIVPAGIHRATIKKAEERCVEWKKNDANPSGECLSLRLSVGNFQYVFADIPSDKTWLARQLAEALGIVAADGTLRIVPGDIEGEEIEVDFKHFTNRQGVTKADVKAYLPKATTPAAAPPAKRQTLPQKAAATFRANGGADDIPFAWLVAVIASVIGGAA